MVHAALLLLMLEAVTKDLVFTISLKRSTQNLQLSTSWADRLHHLLARADIVRLSRHVRQVPNPKVGGLYSTILGKGEQGRRHR